MASRRVFYKWKMYKQQNAISLWTFKIECILPHRYMYVNIRCQLFNDAYICLSMRVGVCAVSLFSCGSKTISLREQANERERRRMKNRLNSCSSLIFPVKCVFRQNYYYYLWNNYRISVWVCLCVLRVKRSEKKRYCVQNNADAFI